MDTTATPTPQPAVPVQGVFSNEDQLGAYLYDRFQARAPPACFQGTFVVDDQKMVFVSQDDQRFTVGRWLTAAEVAKRLDEAAPSFKARGRHTYCFSQNVVTIEVAPPNAAEREFHLLLVDAEFAAQILRILRPSAASPTPRTERTSSPSIPPS